METNNIYLLVFDTKENFEKSRTRLGAEGYAFKKIICVQDEIEFEREFQLIPENELVFMVVHVFFTDNINGIKRFAASRIKKRYPKLGFMFVSEGDSKYIKKLMIDEGLLETEDIHKYWEVQSVLEDERIPAYTKKQILQLATGNVQTELQLQTQSQEAKNENQRFKYAIITALEEDEMEQILPFIKKEGEISHKKHLIEYGHWISKPSKKIVYASQQNTGMVDAAILATELLTNFKPDFLIMPGVLGGKPEDVNIGDIIVSTKVFTVDKGKLTEEKELAEEVLKSAIVKEQINIIENEKSVKRKDEGGVFKKEIESVSLDSNVITKFVRYRKDILYYINKENRTRKKTIDLLFGPIACVRQVIDQKGYFEKNILVLDRKAVGLEMESYGVARACELANSGHTTAIIVKSVMDNTQQKDDDNKTFAAWTSAMFVNYILENDYI